MSPVVDRCDVGTLRSFEFLTEEETAMAIFATTGTPTQSSKYKTKDLAFPLCDRNLKGCSHGVITTAIFLLKLMDCVGFGVI